MHSCWYAHACRDFHRRGVRRWVWWGHHGQHKQQRDHLTNPLAFSFFRKHVAKKGIFITITILSCDMQRWRTWELCTESRAFLCVTVSITLSSFSCHGQCFVHVTITCGTDGYVLMQQGCYNIRTWAPIARHGYDIGTRVFHYGSSTSDRVIGEERNRSLSGSPRCLYGSHVYPRRHVDDFSCVILLRMMRRADMLSCSQVTNLPHATVKRGQSEEYYLTMASLESWSNERDQADMPYTRDGVVPDILFEPCLSPF